MGFYWTGTGFEECEVSRLPSPVNSATSESQPPAILNERSEEAYSSASPRRELRGTQREVQQKMAQELGNHFPAHGEARNSESRKKNSIGPEQYDPLLGVWTRAQEIPTATPEALVPQDPNSGAQPDEISAGRLPQKTARENGSMFKWTSWFRSEPGQGLGLLTPSSMPPEGESQLDAIRADDAEPHSSTVAQEFVAPEAQISAVEEPACSPSAASMAAPETAVLDAPTATGDQNILAPSPSPASDQNPGGSMLQPAADAENPDCKVPRADAESSQPATGGEGSRWFVLNSLLGAGPAREAYVEQDGNVPVLEVFSLGGGVGKTSIVATLGRALSARGEHVLLVEASPLPSLQYFFGACDYRPGALRTFRPPASSSDAPIRLANVEPDTLEAESAEQGLLANDILRWAQGASRVIVDVGTGSTATIRALSNTSPLILVPLVPDVNAVVAARSIDTFFQRQALKSGSQPSVFYVLNQFDSSLPLHLEIGKVLLEGLGDRLLPFVLQRSGAVSEALAEGMTIMDYAPRSSAAAQFASLAKWLEEVLPPATVNSHGRWSER